MSIDRLKLASHRTPKANCLARAGLGKGLGKGLVNNYLGRDSYALGFKLLLPGRLELAPPGLGVGTIRYQARQGVALVTQGFSMLVHGVRQAAEVVDGGPDVVVAQRLHLGQVMQLGEAVHLTTPVERIVAVGEGNSCMLARCG